MRRVKKLLKNRRFLKNMALLVAGFFILIAGIIIIWLFSLKIPDFNSFADRKVINSTQIYDRTGEVLLYDIHKDIKRTDIPGELMGVNIKNATVAIEDSEFYNHKGVRVTSTIRAVLSNVFNFGIGGGGSTITQQLVKNTLLTTGSGYGKYVRKIKEWVLATKIDNSMPKEKILEHYLNEAPYGGTIYGIEEASRTYFGKKPIDLTLAEAAYLASIPQAPTTLSPYGKNKERLESRKGLVLSRMLELKFISKNEYDKARKEVVAFAPQSSTGIKAPHFVFFIKNYLEKKYGSEMIQKGGIKIITTLDYELQKKGEEIVKEGALKNAETWDGENASLMAIDPKTGQILAMVGSRDYFDKEIDGNFNVATASRQPGSSFKPFIYATAFNKGFRPETVLFDLPTEFQTTCDPYGKALPGKNQEDCYMPDNYDGKFRGPMSLRNALAQSINLVAVKLFYLAGLPASLKTAEDMGITTLSDIGRYGLTLVIGGGEVSLHDITGAYGVFANNGVRNPTTGILRIENVNGKILEEFAPRPEEVLPKNTTLLISDVLSDEKARVPTFGAHSPLYVPGKEIAVKTGTTNSNKDAWTIGYTPSLVVGVWAGNNDNTPMKKGGAAVAGPIWNKFISEALKTLPDEKFEAPKIEENSNAIKPVLRGFWQGNEGFLIDKISGKLAGPNTPKETTEQKVITNVHSILYWTNKNDILGAPPENPASDPQFNLWEVPIQNWWAQNSFRYGITTVNDKPIVVDDVHTDFTKPIISIVEPNNYTNYRANERISIRITSLGIYPLLRADAFVNDIYIGTYSSQSFISFVPSELSNLRTENELKIVGYDSAYNKGEQSVMFKVDAQ